MRTYDRRREGRLGLEAYRSALAWLDPGRDTREARLAAESLAASRQGLHCVWTGMRLGSGFDVDHCFPFASWPNNDLWNLLPASPRANQAKSDRLPSADLLHRAHDRIVEWWDVAYRASPDLFDRFREEARASLPVARIGEVSPGGLAPGVLFERVFAGMDNQRVRLKTDQGLGEWGG
jgi:hypothetical protein